MTTYGESHHRRIETDKKTEEYLKYIEQKIIELKEGRFTGNIDFEVNYLLGGIGCLNVKVKQSIKY